MVTIATYNETAKAKRLKEKFQAAGKDEASNDITIRIKGDKARVDVGSGEEVQFSTIIDTRTGEYLSRGKN